MRGLCGWSIVLGAVVVAVSTQAQTPLGTGFYYQGRLEQSGVGVHGSTDMQFRLFGTAAGGTQIGASQSFFDVPVVDGLEGIAHDDTHWYIIQGDYLGHDTPYIWRIPVTVHLGTPEIELLLNPDVLRVDARSAIGDPDRDYDMSDPVVYRYAGTEYLLFVTKYRQSGFGTWVVAFEATTLRYIDSYGLASRYYHSVGVTPAGTIYLNDGTNSLNRFILDWENLRTNGVLDLNSSGRVALWTEAGDPVETGGWSQALEFTPDGEFLYFLTRNDLGVFSTRNWRRVLHSNNGSHPLNLQFDPDGSEGDDLVGLTLWDFQNGGQLHVLVRDNDVFNDDAFLKHYTNIIRVDRSNFPPGEGTPDEPFTAISSATVAAWPPGCEVLVRGGVYPEVLTITKPMRLRAINGAVRIGG